MTNFRADLHTHSTCSDGTKTPEELILLAKKAGLKGLSITDHDSINAYESAIPRAKEEGIWLGAGVEFSTMQGSLSVHLLGYDIDIANEGIRALCKRHLDRRIDRNKRILDKLDRSGMRVDRTPLEEMWDRGVPIGRPHIASALVDAGFVPSIQQAFNQWIGDGKPCFERGDSITTDETIEVVHEAGGKAFLAHPHLMRKAKEAIALLDKPFDGIECYYSKCNPDQERFWVGIAKERGLLVSGGSDFHGDVKPNIPIGCSWVDQDTFSKIFTRNWWS